MARTASTNGKADVCSPSRKPEKSLSATLFGFSSDPCILSAIPIPCSYSPHTPSCKEAIQIVKPLSPPILLTKVCAVLVTQPVESPALHTPSLDHRFPRTSRADRRH